MEKEGTCEGGRGEACGGDGGGPQKVWTIIEKYKDTVVFLQLESSGHLQTFPLS